MTTNLVKFVLFLTCVVGFVSASAIPMWEYLSKDEKMAYLYTMFANQVDEVCNGPKFEECSKDLLKYGLKNLHDMPEDHLDAMDPYQKGANSLIWKSMMDGHVMMQKKQFTTPPPYKDEYDVYSVNNYLGSESTRDETVLNVNGRYVTRVETSTKPPNKHYGPMVVKVHLDGRPVQEEKSIPADDDLHHHHIVKTKVPSLSALEEKNTVFRVSNPYPYAVYSRPSRR